MKQWKRVEPTDVDKIAWRTIVTKRFIDHKGVQDIYGAYGPEGEQYAAVIAVTEENQIVVARQFRIGPEKVMDELPGGGVEADEDLEAAVLRELHEETGYKPQQIEYLGATHKDAYMNPTWHYYLATGCKKVGEQHDLDESEAIDVVLIPIPQLLENARNDNMSDPLAVYWAQDKLKKLQERVI